MPSPPIQVFLTTIASQPALRQRQEYILRILQAKKIEFSSYDLASDEDAKRLWRRKAPVGKQQLPGILIGGTYPGSYDDFEEAVEFDELRVYLRLDEEWDESIEEARPTLPTKAIGVPGASSPSQMAKPEHRALIDASPTPSPLHLRRRNEEEFDVGEELSGFGLQGVKVTEDDLMKLVEELGLEGDEAGDLVKGLSDITGPEEKAPDVAGPEPDKAETVPDKPAETVPDKPAETVPDKPAEKKLQEDVKESAAQPPDTLKEAAADTTDKPTPQDDKDDKEVSPS
ncbi:hypothetical protein FA95DRAFT_1484763 [Auriscalpium vulgare]|uniref:Uncharacterized protein n=1 Tax=Auriscalpium vulgare TaxID=40419 RepID=A0ACB8S6B6_9AGAM|nr:hypothetical protein FA95DRAFT_1484763 [Auriscalpium vulgare]